VAGGGWGSDARLPLAAFVKVIKQLFRVGETCAAAAQNLFSLSHCRASHCIRHFQRKRQALLCRNPRYGLNADSPRETWLPMTRAYPEYIETMLDAVAERHGSIDSYLAEELGVDRRAIARLRDNLLE